MLRISTSTVEWMVDAATRVAAMMHARAKSGGERFCRRDLANMTTRLSMTCANHSNGQNAHQSAKNTYIWAVEGDGQTTMNEYAMAASTSTFFLKVRESIQKMLPRRSTAMKVSEMPTTAPCFTTSRQAESESLK